MDGLSYSLRLLKSRLRTEFEINQALSKRGVEPDLRQEVIAKLKEAKLLDDQRFAEAWVHTRDLLSPRGGLVLRQELLQKGIPDHIISQVLSERRTAAQDEESDQPTEVEQARDLLRRRERTYANLDSDTRKRRQISFLQRRGFTYDVIKRILEA